MSKSTHFFGQPVYGQLIKSLDRAKIVEMSRKNGGEKYVKSFDGYVPPADNAICDDHAFRFTA